MIGLILTLAIVGVIVWAVVTYIPMPDVVKKAIIVVVAICIIVYVLRAFGVMGTDIPVPQLHD